MERGVNALQIETGDCWYAFGSPTPTCHTKCCPSQELSHTRLSLDVSEAAYRIGDPGYKMEQDVDAGILGGSMYGTVEMPAQLQKPRHATRWRQLVKATRRATRAFLTLA